MTESLRRAKTVMTHITLRARERDDALHRTMAAEPLREWTDEDLAPLVRKFATRRDLRHAIRSLIIQRRIELVHRCTGFGGLPSTYRVVMEDSPRG